MNQAKVFDAEKSYKGEAHQDCDNAEATQKRHDIFTRDPAVLFNFMYKKVEISSVTKEIYRGRVYTVDPVSYTFVLCDSNVNSQTPHKLTLVIGHNITDVKILDDRVDDEIKKRIDGMYSLPEYHRSKCSPSDAAKKKAKLIDWFKTNHISIEASKDDETILTINDIVHIRPPYSSKDFYCTNPIVLGKILDILNKMPV